MKFHRKYADRLTQSGSLHYILPLLFVVLFAVVGVWLLVYTHAAAPTCGAVRGSGGGRVASEAQHQWCIWNGGKNSNGKTVGHVQLITWITDGNYGSDNYDWCADFVSYVYKSAGEPFKGRAGYFNRNGWDWPRAADLEHLPGFTYHTVGSGYKPKVGDIAEFNYPGGHAEVVTATKPLTFIYGATASDGMAKDNYDSGHVLGYVTPN